MPMLGGSALGADRGGKFCAKAVQPCLWLCLRRLILLALSFPQAVLIFLFVLDKAAEIQNNMQTSVNQAFVSLTCNVPAFVHEITLEQS